jgi:hypothetical protein
MERRASRGRKRGRKNGRGKERKGRGRSRKSGTQGRAVRRSPRVAEPPSLGVFSGVLPMTCSSSTSYSSLADKDGRPPKKRALLVDAMDHWTHSGCINEDGVERSSDFLSTGERTLASFSATREDVLFSMRADGPVRGRGTQDKRDQAKREENWFERLGDKRTIIGVVDVCPFEGKLRYLATWSVKHELFPPSHSYFYFFMAVLMFSECI